MYKLFCVNIENYHCYISVLDNVSTMVSVDNQKKIESLFIIGKLDKMFILLLRNIHVFWTTSSLQNLIYKKKETSDEIRIIRWRSAIQLQEILLKDSNFFTKFWSLLIFDFDNVTTMVNVDYPQKHWVIIQNRSFK